MTEHRIHYLILGPAPTREDNKQRLFVARCGNSQRKSWTHNPTKVTCGSCKRLMKGEVK